MGAGLRTALRASRRPRTTACALCGGSLCPVPPHSPPAAGLGVHVHYTDGHLRPGAESLILPAPPWDTEAQQVHRVTGDQPPALSVQRSCFAGSAGGCLPATHVAPVFCFLPSDCTPALFLDVSEGVFQSDFSSRARTGLCGEGQHTGTALPPGERPCLPRSFARVLVGSFILSFIRSFTGVCVPDTVSGSRTTSTTPSGLAGHSVPQGQAERTQSLSGDAPGSAPGSSPGMLLICKVWRRLGCHCGQVLLARRERRPAHSRPRTDRVSGQMSVCWGEALL